MKVTIIGGGTAGGLTGLFFNKKGYSDITIIDSSNVGILGAGEATAPNFKGLLFELGINEEDFLKTTGATIKKSNDFINWSAHKTKFSHGFGHHTLSNETNENMYGFHFDARECAKYFKNIGINRGITHLDVNITHFTQNNNGDITNIHTEENIDVQTEFVIDCSGFARLCIGKLYKSKWKSYSEYLKANSAIAYFLPQENGLTETSKTHTQSIAMKYGWMWQAPLRHRWGCGYVFNDTYITNEEAKKEVEDYLGKEITIVKTFKYDAGGYDKTWINNCVSLGLASGFLEPLEGTSLMSVIWSLYKLGRIGLENSNSKNKKIYNDYINTINYQSMLFVAHHYNCGRTDTKFWKDITEAKLPLDLTKILNNLENKTDEESHIFNIDKIDVLPVFGKNNYQVVHLGHKSKTKKTFL
jgi:tryptophan halogenase